MDHVIEPSRTSADQPAGGRSLAPLLRRFVRGAFWSVVASLAARGLPVVAALVVARLLGREAYGQLGVVQNTLNLFTVLSGLGLGLSATRFVAHNRSTEPALAGIYARLAMRITVAAGGLLAVITFLAAPLLARAAYGEAALTQPLQLAAPVVIFAAINSAQMGILTGLEAWRPLALAGVAQGLGTSVLLVLGAITGGVTGAVVALAVAEALSAGVLWLTVRRAGRAAGILASPERAAAIRAERHHWHSLLRFSIPALVSSSLTVPAAMVGTALLTRQPNGLAEMGLFSAASRWSFAVLFLPTAVSRIVLPMLANFDGLGNRADFRRIFLTNAAVSTAAVALPAVTLILLANPLMGLLGADYRVGGSVLVLLLLTTLPITLNDVFGQVLVSTGAIGWRLAFDLALAALLVGLGFVLIPRWEAVGLAAAQVLAYATISVVLAVVVALRLRGGGTLLSDRSVVPVASAPSVSATLASAGATLAGDSNRTPEPAWRGLIRRRSVARQPAVAVIQDRGLIGCLALAWVALLWFCRSMPEPRYLATLVPALGIPLVLALLPACRPALRTPLCPRNWALFILLLQGLILPLVINASGAVPGALPYLPSSRSINQAILISFVAFVAYCLAFQWSTQRAGSGRQGADDRQRERRPPHVPLGIICAAIGLIGFLLSFHGPSELIAYYVSPDEDALIPATATASLGEAAGTFLRPFLGFAIVLFWALWADRRGRSASWHGRIGITALAALALVVVYASFNYNRGAFAAPLLALLAAYSLRVRRIPWKVLIVGGIIGLSVLLFWGLYRTSSYGSLSEIAAQPATRAAIADDLAPGDTLQIYGGAPQLAAYVLDGQSLIPEEMLGGRSLIGSVMSSVPVLGEPFRSTGGVVMFNRLIYGVHPERYDQVMPFQAEVFVSFGLVGVIVAYLLVGLLIARLDRGFHRAPNSVQAFMTQYAAIWLTFLIPGSLAATSQIFIYFFWPVYFYLALSAIGWRSERNASGPDSSSRGPQS